MTRLRVAVVGGGIAGLAAAHRLVELARDEGRALDLVLLEAADRLGGTIRTERVDGFLLEAGADSFISEKPWALALAERIGLGPRLRRTDDRFRRTYVVRGGRLRPLPEGFLLLAPTRAWPVLASGVFSWRGKLRLGLDLVLPRRTAPGDESLGSFVRRRLGREALERVAQPLVGGIYTADPDRLSLGATMPRFLALEREHRSLILGLRRTARAARPPGRAARDGASSSRWPGAWTSWSPPSPRAFQRGPSGSPRRWRPSLGAERLAGRLRHGPPLDADGVVLAGPAPAWRRSSRGGPSPGRAARRDRVRVLGDGGLGLSAGCGPPPSRRLRLRGATGGRARDPRVHVLEREVPGPGAGWLRPPPRLRRGRDAGGAPRP